MGIEAKKKEKRERLIKAGTNLFSHGGYFSTTIEDITSEAGVAKGTFYLYFDDKQQFFEEIINSMAFRHEEDCKMILECRDSRERLKNYIISQLDFYRKNADFAHFSIAAVVTDAENFLNWYVEIQKKHISFLAEIIAQANEDGTFAVSDPYRAAQFLQGAVFMFVSKQVLYPKKPANIETDAEFIVETFLNGVSSASGAGTL
jgi:TetR/AcrR family fatty acid metabolism transcriptional regulator